MPEPEHYLPLSNLTFHVLLALGDGVSHGYAIGKEVEARSDGRLSPTTGALYQALRRLRDEGLVESAPEPAEVDGDPRRKYFQLTELGKRVTAAEARRLDGLVATARAKRLVT